MRLDQKHAIHLIFIPKVCHYVPFFSCVCLSCCYNQLTCLFLLVSAAVFTLRVYSVETRNDLRQGEGNVACGHWLGKTKTTDGLRSVFNPDSTSNPVFTARMSTLHARPDTPNDHSDLNLAELGIKRWLNGCCVSPWSMFKSRLSRWLLGNHQGDVILG